MMAAKSRSPKSSDSPGWFRGSTQLVLLFGLVCALLGGLVWAGRWGLEQLRGRERYYVPFGDIECEPPVGMDREEFLDEVRYCDRRLPRRVHLLNEDLVKQLQEGFALHPWVEKVEAVQLKPPKRIVVKLLYRTPVLAVKMDDALRAVDGNGILLPRKTPTRGLPIYDAEVKPAPDCAPGKRLGDADVETAARKLKK